LFRVFEYGESDEFHEYETCIDEECVVMTASLLMIFIGVLIVLFIIAIAYILITSVRSRNAGKNVNTITDPIPSDRRNGETRQDQVERR
jgi:flagellar basal body-associated protein FliL